MRSLISQAYGLKFKKKLVFSLVFMKNDNSVLNIDTITYGDSGFPLLVMLWW